MSTGYALYSQQLSVGATASYPTFSFTQNMRVTYTTSVSPQGQNWTYTVAVTIYNNGTHDTTAWQSTFSLPAGYSNVSCSSANCTQASNVNTAVNNTSNGTIAAGSSLSYTLTFRTSTQTYTFTSIGASATLAAIYQPVSGLTVTATPGTRTKSGKWYTWPYTIKVTNSSGQNLAGWRMLIPWSTSTNQVASMPTTVNYVEAATQLTILSKQAINNGTNFQFVANLSSTNSSWAMTGYSVQGQF
jgi:hypothetical protein